MSPLNEHLGRRVDWFGRRGTIEGVWTGPTYAIKFDDGEDLTIGADKVTLLAAESHGPLAGQVDEEHHWPDDRGPASIHMRSPEEDR